MDAASKRAHAGSFGAGADAYERARPSYPEAAIEWLLPARARRVLDLGAGTGKLTRALADRGLDVIAVDPSPEMLRRLQDARPDIPVHVGTAEAIPLDDHSVDAILVAQAWHWVDPVHAVPEVVRVLRPGGTLGLVWNARDAAEPWVAAFNRIVDRGEPIGHYDGSPQVGRPFTPLTRHDVAWSRPLDEDELVDLAASRSLYLTLPLDERAPLLDEVRALFRRAADGATTIAMPYVTRCFRTTLTR